jgi:hypothetical protein
MDALETAQLARHRGVIMQFIRNNHFAQRSHMDDLTLWTLMTRMGFTVSQDYVFTLLQELRDADYVKYQEKVDNRKGTKWMERIELTTAGRRLLEGYTGDPLVLIL